MKTTTAESTRNALRSVFTRYELLTQVVSYNGPPFSFVLCNFPRQNDLQCVYRFYLTFLFQRVCREIFSNLHILFRILTIGSRSFFTKRNTEFSAFYHGRFEKIRELAAGRTMSYMPSSVLACLCQGWPKLTLVPHRF